MQYFTCYTNTQYPRKFLYVALNRTFSRSYLHSAFVSLYATKGRSIEPYLI